MSTSRETFRELFLNVSNNQYDEFISKLKSHPKLDLTTTDDCHPSLEKELGGDWFEHGGRAEKNTLLNLALSLNRLEHAEYLIRLHKENKRDIGIETSNKHGLYPLDMVFMVEVNEEKSTNKIEKWRDILFYLWDNKSTEHLRYIQHGDIIPPIHQICHLPPLLAFDLLNRCKYDLKNADKMDAIHQAIRIYFCDHPSEKEKVKFAQLLKADDIYKEILKKIISEPPSKSVKTPFIFNIIDSLKNQDQSPIALFSELNFNSDMLDWKNSIGKTLRSKLSPDEVKQIESTKTNETEPVSNNKPLL